MSKAYEIDFYKEFRLVPPMCGLVSKITSPKGVRHIDDNGYVSYRLHTDLIAVYDNKPSEVESGLYWIMDVCKVKELMTWCHYLFIIEDDGTTYPVYQFLGATDSSWIKDSIKVIKAYFNNEDLPPIKLTRIPYKVNKPESGWNRVRK